METQIRTLAQSAISNKLFPGVVIGVLSDNQINTYVHGGLTYNPNTVTTPDTIYDLASITKAIPTASIILHLIDKDLLSLNSKVIEFIPQIQARYREEITVKHLLTYTVAFDLPKLSEIAQKGGANVMEACFSAQLAARPGTKFIYNNLVSTILALVAEKVTGKKFTDLADEVFFKPLGMNSTTFYPKTAAPTEVDWRGEVTAEVHDESAWALMKAGLTVGHAGLFSTASDLLKFSQMLLNDGQLNNRRFLSSESIRQMHTNQLGIINETLGLGWAIPGGQFDLFGQKVSPETFGMTGFTGTSILIDPVNKKSVVILTNATYPKRKDQKPAMNAFRQKVNDLVFA